MKNFLNTRNVAASIALVATFSLALAACGGAPAASVAGQYLVEPITIGAGGEWALDGLLTMPRAASARNPVPAVVLVQGSGPADRDQTIAGINRPFLDIASHLSANGIAVIRHDKRTYTHGLRMLEELGGSLSVREETIEDAILAAQLLRADPRVDASRVYLLGLSMGGMLAPRINAEPGGNFAGLIMLAGTPRTLSDVMVGQVSAQGEALLQLGMATEDDPSFTEGLALWAILTELFDTIPSMTADVARATPIPALGSSYAYYWWDFIAHPFADYAQRVNVPVLVMQGELDFQVLADLDFAMLQEVFAGRGNVTFKLYEGLNHIFMPTAATNFIEHGMEIATVPGNVDAQVLRDIASWIHAN